MSAWLFRVLLWLPVVLIPLVTSNRTLDPALPVRFLLFSVYLFLTTVFLFTGKYAEPARQFTVRNKQWLLLFLTYFLVSGASLLLQSQNPSDGIYQWLLIFDLGVAVLVFTCLFRIYPAYFDELARGLVILGGISAGVGMTQFFNHLLSAGISHSSSYLLTATFANKNIFAEILCLILPFQVYSLFRLSRYWKIVAGVTVLLSVFLIIVSLSRSAWVSLGLAACILLLVSIIYADRITTGNIRISRIIVLLAGVFLISGASVLLIARFGSPGILQKQVHSLLHPTYGSAKDRLLLWGKTIEIVKENPVLGSGLGSWKIEIMKYGNAGLKSADNLTFYQRPHNDYLWILSEQGLISLILFLWLLAWLIIIALPARSKLEEPAWPPDRLVVLASLIIYCLLSFFAFPRERIEHTILLAALAGALLAGDKTRNIPAAGNSKKFWLIIIPIWLLLLASVVVGMLRYRSESFTRKAFIARDQHLWEESLIQLGKAENMFCHFDPTSTPLAWYKGMAYYNLGDHNAALLAFTTACRLCPYHPHVLNNLASCLVENGDVERAVPFYEKAVGLAPYFNEAWINLAAVRFNARDLEGAYLAIRKADTACKLENYQASLQVIIRARASEYILQLNDHELSKVATIILADDEWLRNMYVKSVKEKRDFNTQLVMDIIWTTKQNGKDSLADRFQKILPLDYYDKNL